MSDYTQVNDYSAKDSLPSGDPAKTIKGSDIDAEFAAIATAITSKADDNEVVKLTTDQTVAGDKTFSGNTTQSGTHTMNAKSAYWTKGADIASANPLVVGSDGNYFDVTGTTGFASMTVTAGLLFVLQFDDVLTLTHHATNLNLPSGANITTAAGDRMLCFATAANTVHVVAYVRASGKPIVGLLDFQSFDSSGTWTKPAGFNTASRVLVEGWAAGASGARDTADSGSGGGGGSYVAKWFALSDLGATETVTVGTGGASVTSGTTNGNDGGNTTFGSLLTAYGGIGGRTSANGGGAGGGEIEKGTTITGGAIGGGTGVATAGANGGNAITVYGGAAGGTSGGAGGGSINAGRGGHAMWGGAGGGGGATATNTVGAGGTSINGGSGGAGAKSTNNATAGTQPGGGGGGCESGNSGAGADGRVRVTVFG